jgi:hypothetical protein
MIDKTEGRNSGYCNSGHWNSGDCNSGHWNSGDKNSGDRNTGYRNSGHWNSGYCNSGHWNTGDGNSGDCNSGDGNSGDRNSGYCNSGHWNSGCFNTNTPPVRLFNKDSTLSRDSNEIKEALEVINKIKTVCVWVEDEKMSQEEKEENPSYKTTGGYLKQRDYKYCWQKSWEIFSDDDKKAITSLPNFDPEIFEEITGVNVLESDENKDDEILTINGVKYKKVEE